MSKFSCIGLLSRKGEEDERAQHLVEHLQQFLEGRGLRVLIDEDTAAESDGKISASVSKKSLAERCDLAIVVGGDGSLLSAARIMSQYNVPVLGVNLGRLGFLTDIRPDEVEVKVAEVLEGKYLVEEHFLLQTEVLRGAKIIGSGDALNDVVIHPGQFIRMIEFELYINEEFVYRQRSDGLIISTPTGSTAYALSGGGPIMHPNLDALVMVPLNAHTLSSRPIVVNGNSRIRILICDDNKLQPHMTCDGQTHVVTESGDEILVGKKSQPLQLIHPLNHNFYETCRTKLGWASHKNHLTDL